jgi:biopolymer transport protein ExbD
MPVLCPSWWDTDAGQCGIGYLWRTSDLIERGIFIGFALMFGYTVFVVIRFSLRYYIARREFRDVKPDDFPEFRRANSKLIADLCPGLGMLRGIAAAAPFLGLAGTAYGIMAWGFVGVGMEHNAAMRALMIGIAASLVTAAAGILVAIPATLSHNLLRTRIETLLGRALSSKRPALTGSSQGPFILAQTLPLRMRFSGLPHFAVLAAPTLACVVMMFMTVGPYETPMGLPVALVPKPCEYRPDSFTMLRLTNDGKVFINEERADWKDLGSRLFAIYTDRQSRELYLYAEEGVPFQSVADAIDIARNVPAAGQDSPDIKVTLITPTADRECGFIPIRIIPVKHAFG